jgi:stage II sporulation protein D
MQSMKTAIKSNPKVPQIRIGIIQSTSEVTFKCDTTFKFINLAGETVAKGEADRSYNAHIKLANKAKIKYQLRTNIEKFKERAFKHFEELSNMNPNVHLRYIGRQISFQNHMIDNRDYWVTIGNFSSVDEAKEFNRENKLEGKSSIVEDISEKATGKITCDDHEFQDGLKIVPDKSNAIITVDQVPIGIEFHWMKKETLEYRGVIEIGLNNDGLLQVVNEIDLESYLASVNSSEMTPDCPIELLEAQTVAARSTVLATMGKHHYNRNYDLCSDDHCQCYQGALREKNKSWQAIETTAGELLMFGEQVCDARYSKICGGITESYPNVWDEQDIPYLIAQIDSEKAIEFPANTEEKAKKLINDSPDVFCNTSIYKIPAKLANLYSAQNLFRWQVVYSRQELEKIISQKLNIDLGELQDIRCLERGASGRLITIELVGSTRKIKIGKELEIRRALSTSHLYSSCFYVEKDYSNDGQVNHFILKGAGWGHGVGLCQIGATVMALKGYTYDKILKHYYQNSQLIKVY